MYSLCVTLIGLIVLAEAPSENWPQWRGPNGNGVAVGDRFPINWSSDENVAWKYPLAERGGSTPIVWSDRIFVSATRDEKNLLVCLDREGNELWEVDLGKGRPGKHKKASGCNPSPVTDGQHVFVYFKSGELACLDFDGKILWRKNLQDLYGDDNLWWDLGTSPVLTQKLLVVACMQSPPSYLVAFDKTTGEVVWKVDRNLEAPMEASQSYSTPLVIERDGAEQLIVLGADHVTAHEAATGKEIWRVGGLNPTGQKFFRSIASPVISGDLVIAPYARGKTLTAIRLGGSGDVTDSHVAWIHDGDSADVPTPASIGGKLYVCTDKGEVVCLEGETGSKLWGQRVKPNRNTFSASPIIAGGHIYVTREDGTTFVLEQGDRYKLVATNQLDESTVATPVFTGGQVLIRTFENLYCIGK